MAENETLEKDPDSAGERKNDDADVMNVPRASNQGGKRNWLPAVIAAIAIALIAVVAGSLILPGESNKISKENFVTTAELEKSIEIDNLYTAEFVYNGIAEHYRDESEERNPLFFWESDDPVDYRIRYKATVRAGIDMKDVKFDVDDSTKVIAVTLPDIELTCSVDPNEMQFIPESTGANPQEVIVTCEEDVRNEAQQKEELFDVAKDNLKSVIEALTLPIAEAKGYSIEWSGEE